MNNLLIITVLLSLIILCIFIISYLNRRKALEEKIQPRDFNKISLSKVDIFKSNALKSKILVVEDDPINRKILSKQLTSAKYSVVVAENGETALVKACADPTIDIILLDIMLPDISGFKVCKEIRKKFSALEKPIIMVTAKNKIEDLIDGFEAGANDFIIKPYNIYELVARINSSLSLKSVSEQNISLTKINKLKSDIIDMAAHDLKSPLTLISGYAKRIISKLPKNTIENTNAQKILNSSDKMLEIVTKLLEDSKYDDFITNFTKENIIQILNDSILFYEDSAKIKNQKIIFNHLDDKIILNIDKQCLVTALDNLLTNAIKYSPFNSIIKIYTKLENSECFISIEDEGDGFTQDEIEHLFVKYFPISNKPTNGECSTGLGLSIANNMIRRINGKIMVESQKGKGAKFIILLPIQ